MLRLAKQHCDQLLVNLVVFSEEDSQRPDCRSRRRQRRAGRFRAPHSRKAEELCKGVEQRLLADGFRQHRIDDAGGAFREAVRPADEAITIFVSARPADARIRWASASPERPGIIWSMITR